jgi:hypothetical protein
MKTATMNIQVDEALRASTSATMPQPGITETESKRRRAAVEDAKASVELEGFHCSSEYEDVERRFIDGEIDSNAMTEYTLQLAKRLAHQNEP